MLVPLTMLLATAVSSVHPTFTSSCETDEWSGWGGNNCNNRYVPNNEGINSSSVASLTQHCKLDYPYGVSATPSIVGTQVYFPTWGGLLVSLDYTTCQVAWQINVTQIIADFAPITEIQRLISSPVARTSPVVVKGVLYFGTLTHALLCAANASDGTVHGCKQINNHPTSILTMSPTVYKTKPYDEFGIILIGASSQEELAASLLEGYQCCSFAGNMVALTFNTIDDPFTVLWNISMLPSPQGNWSGAAIWGSQPSIDPIRSQAFIGTGNVYTLPEEYALCQNQTTSLAVVAKDPCLPPNVLQDSIVALDIMTGLINWADQLTPLDAFNTACDPTAPASSKHNCPFTPGPDADFGMAPTFIPGGSGTPYGRDTVVIGQKNGNLYAVSAQAGRLFWSITTSPDGSAGGLVWGVAVDETQVYFTALNFNQVPFLLQPSGQNIINSAFGAASLKDGSLIWEVQSLPEASLAEVPPTVVNDIVLVGTTGANISDAYTGNGGVLKILDKHTGKLIKSVALNANFHGGIAVQGQYIMFGTGYQEFVNGTGSFYVLRA